MKKRGFLFYLRIYLKITAQCIKSRLSYRSDFIISTFGVVIMNAAGFVSFWVLFRNFSSISDWKYEEMLFLYSFSLIAFIPAGCLFDNNWNLRFNVQSGDFIKYCFRPLNIFFYFISEVFDLKGLGQLTVGIIMLAYSWKKMALGFSFTIFIKLVISLFSASLFLITLLNLSAATCFWMINSGSIMDFVAKFRDYARYPVTIFNSFFRFFFTFVIPIAFISYYPSLIFLRPAEVPLLTYLAPLLGISFFILSYLVWMKGANSYSGTGS